MITTYAARRIPGDRVRTVGNKEGTQQVVQYDSPVLGIDLNVNDGGRPEPGYVKVMDNLLPQRGGVVPRGGAVKRVGLNGDSNHAAGDAGHIDRLIPFVARKTLVAIADGQFHVFEMDTEEEDFKVAATNATTDDPTDFSTRSTGIPVGVETVNDGGTFLTIVNGIDTPVTFNGLTFVDAKLTNADSSLFSYAWQFKGRQYFIEKDSLNAYYLPVSAITGGVTKFPLTGLFKRSKALLFGGSFSTDSGSGIDDFIVFVTVEGEVAIYSGSDPSDADDFKLQGVFDIGEPLSADSHFTIGGDLIIGTSQGLVPLSAVLQKDVAELRLHSLSERIKPGIDSFVALGRGTNDSHFRMIKSDLMGLGIIKPPLVGYAHGTLYAVNLETNAWSSITGWDAHDVAYVDDKFFFTDGDYIYEGFRSGTDNGEPIQHRMLTQFDDLGASGRAKLIHKTRVAFSTSYDLTAKVSLETDSSVSVPIFPRATNTDPDSDVVWGALKQGSISYSYNVDADTDVDDGPFVLGGEDDNGNSLLLREGNEVSVFVDTPDPDVSGGTIQYEIEAARLLVDVDANTVSIISLPSSGFDAGLVAGYVIHVNVSGLVVTDLDSTNARWEPSGRDEQTRFPNINRVRRTQIIESAGYTYAESAALQITFSTDGPSPLDLSISSMAMSFTQGTSF